MSLPQSCLYQGWVRHRRWQPRAHEFRYHLSLMYLDLDEIPALFTGAWWRGWECWAPLAWRRADYLGAASGKPLAEAVRDLVAERTGQRPAGPIRLLTQPRYWGYCFNPVSFYYCYAQPGDAQPATIVAEITNTPWRERHAYVLPLAEASARQDWHTWSFEKQFHVSPFMPMNQRYEWHFRVPGELLSVFMRNEEAGVQRFDATLQLRRRPWSAAAVAASLLAWPCQTLGVVAAIYWQALRLWLKGVPFHPHPPTSASQVAGASVIPRAPLAPARHE